MFAWCRKGLCLIEEIELSNEGSMRMSHELNKSEIEEDKSIDRTKSIHLIQEKIWRKARQHLKIIIKPIKLS